MGFYDRWVISTVQAYSDLVFYMLEMLSPFLMQREKVVCICLRDEFGENVGAPEMQHSGSC